MLFRRVAVEWLLMVMCVWMIWMKVVRLVVQSRSAVVVVVPLVPFERRRFGGGGRVDGRGRLESW